MTHGGFFHQVKGLSDLLKTNLETGIYGDEVDLLNRKTAFGSNTYPLKKGRSFWVYYLLLSPYLLLFLKFYLYGRFFACWYWYLCCFAEVPLGGMARFNPYHIDCSCFFVFGVGNKDRGSTFLFTILFTNVCILDSGFFAKVLMLPFFIWVWKF